MATPFIGPAWAQDGNPFLVAVFTGKGVTHKRHLQRTRPIIDDFGNAVCFERRCSDCLRWLPLDFAHFSARSDGVALGMGNRCMGCGAVRKLIKRKTDPESVRASSRASYRRRMQNPEYRAQEYARMRQNSLARKARDPEAWRAATIAAGRRYRAKLAKDRERRLRKLESQRLSDRLRKERKTGRRITRNARVAQPHDVIGNHLTLPGPPVAEAIRRYAHTTDSTLTDVCDKSGFVLRAYDRWNHGEGASIPAVDGFLTFSGLCWWEVWTEESGTYEEARALFEADDLRRAA